MSSLALSAGPIDLSVKSETTVVPPPPRPPIVRPVAAERYEIRFTARADMVEKLRLVQDMLSHAVPSGDLAEVFDRALTVLIEDLARKKFAITPSPRLSRGQSKDSGHIPAEVRRSAFVRDRGRCTYVAPDGRRCDERRFLQFDHILPRGAGGKPTLGNTRLRCGPHNRLAAELFYGRRGRYGTDEVKEPGPVSGFGLRYPSRGG